MRLSHVRNALLLAALLGVADKPAANADRHCACHARIVPVEGSPGAFLVETDHGSTVARTPPRRYATPDFIIEAQDVTWEADGNPLTEIDTLTVPLGSTVRWHLVTGIHTLTNGHDSGDPAAGTTFDYLLNEVNPDFDSTFTAPDTLDFFCYFHEPSMLGTLIVSRNGTPTRPMTWGEVKRRYR